MSGCRHFVSISSAPDPRGLADSRSPQQTGDLYSPDSPVLASFAIQGNDLQRPKAISRTLEGEMHSTVRVVLKKFGGGVLCRS